VADRGDAAGVEAAIEDAACGPGLSGQVVRGIVDAGATFGQLRVVPMTLKPQEARWLRKVVYWGGVLSVPLPQVTIGLLKPQRGIIRGAEQVADRIASTVSNGTGGRGVRARWRVCGLNRIPGRIGLGGVQFWRLTGIIRHCRRTPRGNPADALFADRAGVHHTCPEIRLDGTPLKDLEPLDAAFVAGTFLHGLGWTGDRTDQDVLRRLGRAAASVQDP
jgi:hypothetical protein